MELLGADVDMKENVGYYDLILDKQYDRKTMEMEQIEMVSRVLADLSRCYRFYFCMM